MIYKLEVPRAVVFRGPYWVLRFCTLITKIPLPSMLICALLYVFTLLLKKNLLQRYVYFVLKLQSYGTLYQVIWLNVKQCRAIDS